MIQLCEFTVSRVKTLYLVYFAKFAGEIHLWTFEKKNTVTAYGLPSVLYKYISPFVH